MNNAGLLARYAGEMMAQNLVWQPMNSWIDLMSTSETHTKWYFSDKESDTT